MNSLHVTVKNGWILAAAIVIAAPADAETPTGFELNRFGMPGLLDMPSAQVMPDAELATSMALADGLGRVTLSFQITPRLTGAFRYSIIEDFDIGGTQTRYDRSFDLHYRLLDEGDMRPSVAVGLRDFVGSGLYSSEYIVATKHIGHALTVSGGIGWGRLGSHGSFANPFGADTRPRQDDLGGNPNFDQWFRGPAALFAGVNWQVNERLGLKVEYSSDAYERERSRGLVERDSPFNFGLSYELQPGFTVEAAYLHGTTLGLNAHLTLNPLDPPLGGDRSPSPLPIQPRAGSAASWDGAILQDPARVAQIRGLLAEALKVEGLVLTHLDLTPTRARLRIRNSRYDSVPQAIGRAARILAMGLPPSVEIFEIEPEVQGIAASRVVLRRSDLEELEFAPDGLSRSWHAAQVLAGGPPAGDAIEQPRLTWGVRPYIATAVFDPDDPLRADLGIEASARYAFSPNLSLSGAVRQKLVGNRDASTRLSDSVLPHVRSDSGLYHRESFGLSYLTLDHYGRIGPDLYSRVSVGYLEDMFGGVSGEVLWKPVDSRLALGAELNYVMQRDTDKLFGFDEYDYDVVTGHLSAYYDFESGYSVQLDAGRYLAGDYGATFTLERVFDNGWRVGAFATMTDVSFDDFGEGSFDKGIMLTIPTAWLMGQPTTHRNSVVLRPVQRDGGARLHVNNRLHDMLREYHAPEMGDQWGRFWR